MIRAVTFDLVTLRERNQRFASIGGRMAQASREKAQRKAGREMCRAVFGDPPGLTIVPTAASIAANGERYSKPNAIKVTTTRIGPGRLDSDGPSDAMKNVRDGIADWLGVNDGDGSVHWVADQERSPNGSPWRVRITIEDLTFGPDRPPVVLASTVPQRRSGKRAKAKGVNGSTGKPSEQGAGRRSEKAASPVRVNDPVQLTIGDDEQSPRVLVPCSRASCFAALGLPCIEDGGVMIHGVHVERAQAAGVLAARARGVANVKRTVPAPPLVPVTGTLAEATARRVAAQEACRTGAGSATWAERERAVKEALAVEQQHLQQAGLTGRRRIVKPVLRPAVEQAPLPIVRVLLALPWLRKECATCDGRGWHGFAFNHDVRDCEDCNGTGRGKAQAVPEPRIDGLRYPEVHRVAVPHQHASAWGKVIEMYPRRATVAGCDVVIYETKEQRR